MIETGQIDDDRQAEPRATGASRAGLVGAVEPFEDALLLAFGDADAVIGVKYGSSQVMSGAAEVIAYGTAVKYK